MGFVEGYILGILTVIGLAGIATYAEWQKRRKIEMRVDRIWKHLTCGKGILGCDEGPNCTWDHK